MFVPPESSPSGQLPPGASLGQYRIEEHLGTGGMGTVYKATDTKLGRAVALKLLRPEMLDAAGIARFAVREAISLCSQIAAALEAAHARQIIHRDLKPANVKITGNGQVKVLDFGLAKPMERARETGLDENTATLTEQLTEKMTVIGTPAYMSPEQACGRELDARTDIWSFGCVLYEALTGKQVFRGKTITETLAAVVEREPEWAALPQSTPLPVESLLKRCLERSGQTAARHRRRAD